MPGRLLRKLKTERCLRSSASWRTDVTWADPRPSEGLGQEPSVQCEELLRSWERSALRLCISAQIHIPVAKQTSHPPAA